MTIVSKVGSEILVNTATAGSQTYAQITALANGSFVVTWTDPSQGVGGTGGDSSLTAVKAQMFAASGAKVGSEILVNTATSTDQIVPQITALLDGGFVVTWTDFSEGVGGAGGDTSNTAVKAQVFSVSGSKVGSEILVNTATTGDQSLPTITTLSNGGFVVTWTDYSMGVGGTGGDTSSSAVKAQVFAAGGTKVGSEILVNTATASDQDNPQITALSNGGFVVTWSDLSQGVGGTGGDASGYAVKAQVFAAGGTKVGSEILVNTSTASHQSGAQITSLSNGGFVVTWQDLSAGGDSGYAVRAQVFAANGTKVGGESLVNSATAGDQVIPQITALSNGGFVVTWRDASAGVGGAGGDSSGYAVKAQVFAADGTKVGSEILVNTATANEQANAQITALSNGGFLVTWEDSSHGVGGAGGDSGGTAVKAQVFSAGGTKVGSEILVNTATASDQSIPQVTALSNGGFAVTWHDSSQGVGGAGGDSSGMAVKVQVFALNEAPVNAAPSAVTAGDNGTVTFSASLNTAVTVSDNEGDALTTTLDVVHGTLTLGSTAGLTSVSGNGTGHVVVSGSPAAINSALSGLSYQASPGFGGNDTLTISTSDGDESDTDVVAIDARAAVPHGYAKVGSEILVNTSTANHQTGQQITALSNGGFVVTWTDLGGVGGDSSNSAGRAQVFTAGGTKVGSEILVNTATVTDQSGAQITALSDGGFVVTWADLNRVGGAAGDSSSWAVKAQVFAAGGTKVGSEILVNTATAGRQDFQQITALSDGGFVVTWNDLSQGVGGAGGDTDLYAVKAQVFAAGGTKVGSEILVNTATASAQINPQITALSNGGFVVTWDDFSQGVGGAGGDSSNYAVKAQIFAAGGTKVGSEILVNSATTSTQSTSQITALSNGGFVVTWQDFSQGVGGAGGDISGYAVKAQVFAAGGTKVGSEILVNTATAGDQDVLQITALSNGGFVVTWQDDSLGVDGAVGDGSSTAVKAQVFAAGGTKVGSEILVNTATANDQSGQQITALSNGGFILTWTDLSAGGGGASGDSSGSAVKAQVFTAAGTKVGSEFLVNTATANNQSAAQITALSNGGFVVTWDDDSQGVGGAGGDTILSAVKAQVFALNQAPVNDVPGAQSVAANTNLVFNAAGGNAVSISDADGASGNPTVTLSVAHGALTLGSLTGLTFTAGDGTADAAMTFTGSIASINAALEGLRYRASSNYTGADTLTITTNDNEVSAGSPQSDADGVSIAVLPATSRAPHDFNGDGKSDILWRNDAGVGQIWDMNGPAIQSATSIGLVPTNWNVVGTGDFNGDGKTDLIWRNDAGVTQIWNMDNATIASTRPLGVIPSVWQLAGTGDFNGDGNTDMLWRNDNGTVQMWDMNDGAIVGAHNLGVIPAAWKVAGTGDFNGDGKTDLLWRNDSGVAQIWDMDGGNILSATSLGSIPTNWEVAGVGDFNGDSKSDILWRNDSGVTQIWNMNNATIDSTRALGVIPTTWEVGAVGDYNGDHMSDIVWRNDSGVTQMWQMNDGAITQATSLGVIPNNWQIIA
ncbi:VCBS repeat-containing protein [Bradyrhizobium lablabi]|uniref:beta strand repeat-containing protein n=1 Tax=Bradyrhizobium lablabi TaxID=722472 RepID=UPI001BA7E7D5|nr:VCBS repeat-containing protein [Bradyrhizobium lablabi]